MSQGYGSKGKEPSSKSIRSQMTRAVVGDVPAASGSGSFSSRRRIRKTSTSAKMQLAQMKKGVVDLETPDSVLAHVDLRALINRNTFASLLPEMQQRLVNLLPDLDRVDGSDNILR
jgi:hypothetical protein